VTIDSLPDGQLLPYASILSFERNLQTLPRQIQFRKPE